MTVWRREDTRLMVAFTADDGPVVKIQKSPSTIMNIQVISPFALMGQLFEGPLGPSIDASTFIANFVESRKREGDEIIR